MILTVYFDSDFWYGLVEYYSKDNNFRVLKYTFGKSPKNSDVISFINNKLDRLIFYNEKIYKDMNYEQKIDNNYFKHKKINPKRMQREINKNKKKPVISTKSQQVLKESRNLNKKKSKQEKKKQKSSLKIEAFRKKQEKKLKKRKGH